VEVIADDPRVRQRRADRLAVGVVGIDRDHLDPGTNLAGQRAQPPLDGAPVAAVEHLDHAATVQVGDHRGQLMTAAVVRLVQRQAPRPVLARLEPVGAVGEGARDLVAGGALLARDLGMGGAIRHSLAQARAEPAVTR
jgi:hypothetical protein